MNESGCARGMRERMTQQTEQTGMEREERQTEDSSVGLQWGPDKAERGRGANSK